MKPSEARWAEMRVRQDRLIAIIDAQDAEIAKYQLRETVTEKQVSALQKEISALRARVAAMKLVVEASVIEARNTDIASRDATKESDHAK